MKCKDEPRDLPAWIIDQLPPPPSAPDQPWLERPMTWTEPPTAEDTPRGTGGTVIVIDL